VLRFSLKGGDSFGHCGWLLARLGAELPSLSGLFLMQQQKFEEL